VIGPPGAGKGAYINTMFNENVTAVGDGSNRCTTILKPFVHPYRLGETEYRLIVVDTPGFDEKSPADVINLLNRVSAWLKASYDDAKKVYGFLYLRDISKNAMQPGPSKRQRALFCRLARDEMYSSIYLVTIKWSEVLDSVGSKHSDQLKDNFWSDFEDHGSGVEKFKDTHKSAMDIVQLLL
ncbi:hypothetical protein BDQ17DRAFT_1221013, partial [Cyathus striatus]